MISACDINWEIKPAPWPSVATECQSAGLSEEALDALDRLGLSEACVIGRVVDVTTERDIYRELAQQAFHALHIVTLERDVLRGQRRLDLQRRRQS